MPSPVKDSNVATCRMNAHIQPGVCSMPSRANSVIAEMLGMEEGAGAEDTVQVRPVRRSHVCRVRRDHLGNRKLADALSRTADCSVDCSSSILIAALTASATAVRLWGDGQRRLGDHRPVRAAQVLRPPRPGPHNGPHSAPRFSSVLRPRPQHRSNRLD